MDNLCHTLVGLALGEAGLKRRTPLATATLVIGANLPDVDILSYAWGPVTALGFRRGWTHGLPALAVWPFALAGLLLVWDRWVRRRTHPDRPPAGGPMLLALATLAVLTHPLLDWLNVYGMRWLMPFDGRWSYGDTLFIVDPWIWLALLTGIIMARRRERVAAGASAGVPAVLSAGVSAATSPAVVSLAAVAVYIAVMGVLGIAGRRTVHRALAAHGTRAGRLMVAPAPLNPLRRDVVFDVGGSYGRGVLRSPGGFALNADAAQVNASLPSAEAAAATPQGRTFLAWARFPLFVFGPYEGCPLSYVCIRDARYFGQSWAEVAVPAVRPVSLAPPHARTERP